MIMLFAYLSNYSFFIVTDGCDVIPLTAAPWLLLNGTIAWDVFFPSMSGYSLRIFFIELDGTFASNNFRWNSNSFFNHPAQDWMSRKPFHATASLSWTFYCHANLILFILIFVKPVLKMSKIMYILHVLNCTVLMLPREECYSLSLYCTVTHQYTQKQLRNLWFYPQI